MKNSRRKLSKIDKIVILSSLISLILLVFTDPIINLVFTKSVVLRFDLNGPIIPGVATISLEEGDRVRLTVETNAPVRYSLRGYYVRQNLGSEFDPIRTRFIVVDGTRVIQDTYSRVFRARIVGTYVAEIIPIEEEAGDKIVEVKVAFEPLERPNWTFRLRVTSLVVLAIAGIYLFGRFYEEPMTDIN